MPERDEKMSNFFNWSVDALSPNELTSSHFLGEPLGMPNTGRGLGIVLFQLGGPDTLEAIQPFLFNLFCDPDIIDFPFARIGRRPLAKLVSATRAKRVQHHYAAIGGGSPIRKFTEIQARALESRLRALGLNARCFVAMRYWHPFTVEAIQKLQDARCDEVVLLPLYPHYSSTTTGSSLNECLPENGDSIR